MTSIITWRSQSVVFVFDSRSPPSRARAGESQGKVCRRHRTSSSTANTFIQLQPGQPDAMFPKSSGFTAQVHLLNGPGELLFFVIKRGRTWRRKGPAICVSHSAANQLLSLFHVCGSSKPGGRRGTLPGGAGVDKLQCAAALHSSLANERWKGCKNK